MNHDSFPINCLSILVPFLEVREYVKLRQTFSQLLGERINEVLSYPHEVSVSPASICMTHFFLRLSRHTHRVEKAVFPIKLISGFSRLLIEENPGMQFDFMSYLIIPNAKNLVYLKLRFMQTILYEDSFKKKSEIVLPQLTKLNLSNFEGMQGLNNLSCPVIEHLDILVPGNVKDGKQSIFFRNHCHLFQRLTVYSGWFNDFGPGIELLHNFKNLRELVVCNVASSIGRWMEQSIYFDDLNLTLNQEQFWALPKSMRFLLDEHEVPKKIRFGSYTFALEAPLNSLQRETGLSLFTFKTAFGSSERLMCKDGILFQLDLPREFPRSNS